MTEVLERHRQHNAPKSRQSSSHPSGIPFPVADAATLSVHWAGKTCPLGHTLRFKLLQRLAAHPNRYVSYDQLLEDVWGATRTDDTVRSVVRHLKHDLNSAGMEELASAICGRDHHYALWLEPQG